MKRTGRGQTQGRKTNIHNRDNIEELVLSTSKLKFCGEQLQNLNFVFNQKLNKTPDTGIEKSILLAKSVTERLIQRLLCGVGILDSRFTSKFLIALHNQHDSISQNLEYVVRIDALSKPQNYISDQTPRYSVSEEVEGCPPGYAKLQLRGSTTRTWADCINSGGYLRRDKVQAKLVELLAQAASNDFPNSPLSVDESTCCAAPGKVIDAATLYRILQIPPEEHVFYGPAGNTPRFPDPRDFRLAIVDEPNGIRLRMGFLSPALAIISIQVRLLIGIAMDSWPRSSDFPFRISLGHADCLLYQTAAQTGMYLVGYGVQSSAWQIRLPAAENVLLYHHGPTSTIVKILQTLFDILEEVNNDRRQNEMSYHILNRYALMTILFYEMERDQANPTQVSLHWSPKYLSTYILKILDTANLLINPGHLCDDDFMMEASKINTYLLRLFDESLMSMAANENFNTFLISQNTETILLHKWKELIDGLTPPSSTRGRRFCFSGSKYRTEIAFTQYTNRQLEYIGLLLKNVLNVKQRVIQIDEEYPWSNIIHSVAHEGIVEDLIYILVTILEQARDQYIENATKSNTLSRKISKIRMQFNVATTKLVELVRREHEMINLDCTDDTILVKMVLKWLYKGLDQSKRHLAPILRPYLNNLFIASHGISWHLEAIRNREKRDEIKALGQFAKLVNSGSITPAQGLIDAVNKNWIWAKVMLQTVQHSNLRIIFLPENGVVHKHILSLPSGNKPHIDGTKSLDNKKYQYDHNRSSTLPARNYFDTILRKFSDLPKSNSIQNMEHNIPYNDILRDASPMSTILKTHHRFGDHRCCGDVLQALLAMQKLNILQEVSMLLPVHERSEMLDTVHKLASERNRRINHKHKSRSLANFSNSRSKASLDVTLEGIQKYTQKEESAGIKIEDSKNEEKNTLSKLDKREHKLHHKSEETLIGSCRAARIRDDNSILHFQDSFKVQSLMKHSSFKY